MGDPTTLVQQATSRSGLLSTSDLNALGLSGRQLANAIAAGDIHRVRRGFYIRGPAEPTWRHRLAATYAHLEVAVVSHRAAARLWGLRSDDDLDFIVPYPRKLTAAGASIHRSRDLHESDLATVEGFLVTGVVRTLCDLGLVLPPPEVQRTVDHVLASGLLGASELRRLRERVGEHGRNGVGAIDAALADVPAPEVLALAESGPELALFRAIARSGLPTPIPQHSARAAGRRYRLDFAYPDVRIALEFDGEAHHSTPAQLAADARRQRHLETGGWIIVRIRWEDLQPINAPATMARIRRAFRQRGVSIAPRTNS